MEHPRAVSTAAVAHHNRPVVAAGEVARLLLPCNRGVVASSWGKLAPGAEHKAKGRPRHGHGARGCGHDHRFGRAVGTRAAPAPVSIRARVCAGGVCGHHAAAVASDSSVAAAAAAVDSASATNLAKAGACLPLASCRNTTSVHSASFPSNSSPLPGFQRHRGHTSDSQERDRSSKAPGCGGACCQATPHARRALEWAAVARRTAVP